MNPGTVSGGWEFVWAAYIITWTALALYGAYLILGARAGVEPPDERNN